VPSEFSLVLHPARSRLDSNSTPTKDNRNRFLINEPPRGYRILALAETLYVSVFLCG
jgi:hypothetical protein